MTDAKSTNDPHGYARLSGALVEAEQRLRLLGDITAATTVHRATLFYGGGSPTEFLGEARLALQAVQDRESLPEDLRTKIRELIEEINEGFRRVGS